MLEKVPSKDAKELLTLLDKSKILKSVYLAGETALTSQIWHRYSDDFDFYQRRIQRRITITENY